MGSLILIFTVIAATILQINNVYSAPLTENDVEHVLQTLQNLLQQEHSKKQKVYQDQRLDDDDDDDTDQYGSLKNYQVKNLLHLSKGDRHKPRDKVRQRSNNHDLNKDQLGQQILEQLLHTKQDRSNKKRKFRVKQKAKKHRQLPNDLLGSLGLSEDRVSQLDYTNENNDNGAGLDLSDYSKVYVVLNSEAVKSSKNKRKLNDFLTNLLSASSDNQRSKKKETRYKGFLLKDFEARRSIRDSKELSGDDYRPKRSRGDRGGGGGGGRTAIPYIRHRGDIYEKGD